MKNTVFIIIIFLLGMKISYSQVAINEDASDPDPSAMLDIKTTKMGLLIPRMNFIQMYGIERPAKGLLVFNTTANTFYFFDGSRWKSINDSAGTTNAYTLHLQPTTPPLHPETGDIYMDKNAGKLRCWDGKEWRDLW